ncbi:MULTISPECIES: flavin reductase family protein [Streptomyces]|uniref:flavin reductase family protein n=1 Tax=Streptomyces TaxID=1883 RepID=UPI001E4B3326|nr:MULTISPECIES: flavin reductase family protein [Streptomyces]UFQ19075.1 flavin reductase family protein [Streptomyces huasconensis]WCL88694.1 flavin reductase family protein [Streptomyces sp. JCM 35825]
MTRTESAERVRLPEHPSSEFRRSAGRFPTGVTVLTCVRDGEPHGMTVNSFTTVSLDPLLVLAVLGTGSQTTGQLLAGDGFAVTVLSSRQEQTARSFADPSRARGGAAFSGVAHAPARRTGSPVLLDGIVYFDCAVESVHTAGDHTILVGAVQAFGPLSEEPALLFSRSRLGAEPDLRQP